MDDYAKQLGRDAIRNPYFIFSATLLISAAIIYVAKSWSTEIGTVWSEVINTIAAAILTAGTFGLWFDFFGKRKLIKEVVQDAVGQTKSLSAGITDVELKVIEINEKQDILTSNKMQVGVRRSAKLFDRYKDEIRTRLNSGKSILIIKQKDASMFPAAIGYNASPDDFLKSLEASEPGITKNVEVHETDELMSYNFVLSDRGIWIKMYFNARQADLPPAFFVADGTPLYLRFYADITKLFGNGRKVSP